jgi:hypothetical protein
MIAKGPRKVNAAAKTPPAPPASYFLISIEKNKFAYKNTYL